MCLRYARFYEKVRAELKSCRDREIRVKIELLLLGVKLDNVSEACSRRGFSRKFYYKWMRRLKKSGYELRSLKEYSRRPKLSPLRTSKKVEARVLYLNKGGYGSRMIQALLKREGIRLATSTICHILNRRRKVTRTRRERLKAHRRRYELPIPGQRVQVDVKYVPEFITGLRAYSYVAIDECTRLRFAYTYFDIKPSNTIDFLERLKAALPFQIHTVQTDNGNEFTYRLNPCASHLKHPMDDWCERNGINHRCIPPGEKELNGKVERSHRLDDQYFYWDAPTDFIENFQAAQDAWMKVYNHDRPHGGIEFLTPMQKLWERYELFRKPETQKPLGYELLALNFVSQLPKRVQELRQLHSKRPKAA